MYVPVSGHESAACGDTDTRGSGGWAAPGPASSGDTRSSGSICDFLNGFMATGGCVVMKLFPYKHWLDSLVEVGIERER